MSTQQEFLQLFWDLAAAPEARIAAASRLVAVLSSAQAKHVAGGGHSTSSSAANGGASDSESSDDNGDDDDKSAGSGSGGESESDDEDERKSPSASASPFRQPGAGRDADARWSPDFAYALRRLFRGLASSRAGARQGFSLALTELLMKFDDGKTLTSDDLLSCLKQHVTSGASRSDRRNHMFARVFAILVFCRAGRLPSFDDRQVRAFADELTQYASQAPLLRELCAQAQAALVASLPIARVHAVLWGAWEKEFPAHLSDLTPEQVIVGVALKRAYAAAHRGKDDTPRLVHRLLERKHLHKLAAPLAAAAHVHPKVHAVWHTVIDYALADDDGGEGASAADTDAPMPLWWHLWDAVVERGALLTPSASLARRFLAMRVFALLFDRLTAPGSRGATTDVRASRVARLFTQSFMRMWMGALGARDMHLHPCAAAVKDLIARRLGALSAVSGGAGSPASAKKKKKKKKQGAKATDEQADGADAEGEQPTEMSAAAAAAAAAELAASAKLGTLRFLVVSALTGAHGSPRFDVRTRSTLVRSLVAALDNAGIDGFARFLIDIVVKPLPAATRAGVDDALMVAARNSAVQQQCWAVHQLHALCKNPLIVAAATAAAADDADAAGDDSWSFRILTFFFFHGFFRSDMKPKVKAAGRVKKRKKVTELAWSTLDKPLAPRVRAACQERCLALLGDLQKATQCRPAAWYARLHDYWAEVDAADHEAYRPLDEAAAETRGRVLAAAAQLRKRSVAAAPPAGAPVVRRRAGFGDGGVGERADALEMLLLHLSLILLNERGDDDDDADDGDDDDDDDDDEGVGARIEELLICSEAAFDEKKRGGDWVGVLVDVLVSLLVRKSSLLRDAARTTIVAFAGEMTAPALDTLTMALLDDGADGDADEDDDDDEDEAAIMRDAAEAAMREASEAAVMDVDGDDASSDDDDDDAGGDETVQAVADGDKLGERDEEYETIGLDKLEASLGEYDTAIEAMLSHRNAKRNERRGAAELRLQRTHFKLRVLDLLEAFVAASNARACNAELVVSLVMPMLNAICVLHNRLANRRARSADAKSIGALQPLVDRLVTVFKTKVCKVKFRADEAAPVAPKKKKKAKKGAVDEAQGGLVQTATDSVRAIVELAGRLRAGKGRNEAFILAVCSHALKCLIGGVLALEGGVDAVVAPYAEAVASYLSVKHASFNTKFFIEFLHAFPALGLRLLGPLLAATPGAATAFLQVEGFVLMHEAVSRRQAVSRAPGWQQTVRALAPQAAAAMASTLSAVGANVKPRRLGLVFKFGVGMLALLKRAAEEEDDDGAGRRHFCSPELNAAIAELPADVRKHLERGILREFELHRTGQKKQQQQGKKKQTKKQATGGGDAAGKGVGEGNEETTEKKKRKRTKRGSAKGGGGDGEGKKEKKKAKL